VRQSPVSAGDLGVAIPTTELLSEHRLMNFLEMPKTGAGLLHLVCENMALETRRGLIQTAIRLTKLYALPADDGAPGLRWVAAKIARAATRPCASAGPSAVIPGNLGHLRC